MRRALVRPLGILALLLAAAAAARADVVVVDPAGGPGGALLQGAINAAHDGDILLLRSGDYTDADITVSGKLLSLVADPPGAQATLRRLFVTLPFALGETVLLRGLGIQAPPVTTTAPGNGLQVMGQIGNTPAVWLEDCTVTASLQDLDGPGGLPTTASSAIFLGLLSSGVVVRCSGTGADGHDAVPGDVATGGGDGLQAIISSVAVFEGSFTGGAGGDGLGDGVISTDGGDGAMFVGSSSVVGSTLRGGDEGADNPASTKPGAGLNLSGHGSLRDADVQAGSVVGLGTASPPIVMDPLAVLTTYPAAARTLEVPSPRREGQSSTLSLHGVVGDAAWVYVGADSRLTSVPAKQGVFLLDAVLPSPVFAGPITDPGGALQLAFQMPSLPPGMDGSIVFLQAAMAPAAGGVVTGSGSALLWLDGTL